MFAVVDIGTETISLQNIYQRQFGWLPIEEYMILDRDNNILTSNEDAHLSRVIQPDNRTPLRGTAYT